jgi:hypothetical protein
MLPAIEPHREFLFTFAMLLKAVVGALLLSFAVLIVTATLPKVASTIASVRTDAAQDAGLNCSTGSGETSCEITLTDESAYPDTSAMTVTETSPGSADRTSSTTVQADRTTLTIAGLTASTSYTFTVDYDAVAADIDGPLNSLLVFVPFLWGIGALVLVVVAVVVGFAMYVSKKR